MTILTKPSFAAKPSGDDAVAAENGAILEQVIFLIFPILTFFFSIST